MNNSIKSIIVIFAISLLVVSIIFYNKSEPVILNVTVKLLNKCELIDKAFMVVTVPEDKEAFFIDGLAKMSLQKNTSIRLEASSEYPGFSYNGIPQKVTKEIIQLTADCSTPDRLEDIFDSMRDQFKSEEK